MCKCEYKITDGVPVSVCVCVCVFREPRVLVGRSVGNPPGRAYSSGEMIRFTLPGKNRVRRELVRRFAYTDWYV